MPCLFDTQVTLKRFLMTAWCALDSTGYPFLLVRNSDVGTTTAFTGSDSHLSITASLGRSGVSSKATPKRLLLSQRERNLSHLQPPKIFQKFVSINISNKQTLLHKEFQTILLSLVDCSRDNTSIFFESPIKGK